MSKRMQQKKIRAEERFLAKCDQGKFGEGMTKYGFAPYFVMPSDDKRYDYITKLTYVEH